MTVVGVTKYPVKYGKRSSAELLDLGVSMLRVFASSIRPVKVIGVEVPFRLPVHDPRSGELLPVELVGSIDLIEAQNDELAVTDLKTASKKWSSQEAERSLQASLYAYALSELVDLADDTTIACRFDVITKCKSPTLQQLQTTRTNRSRDRILALVADVHRATEQMVFHVNPGWQCQGCPFRTKCASED